MSSSEYESSSDDSISYKSEEEFSESHSSSSDENSSSEEELDSKQMTGLPKQEFLIWKSASNGEVPPNAVQIGQSAIDGEMMFVGRASVNNDLIPGKVVPSHECCYVSYGGNEEKSSEYDILVNEGNCELEWMSACDGVVPSGAIEAGKCTDTNEPLYVGRSSIPDEPMEVHGGKIHPSHGCCYVPYGGREIACNHYEVLCTTPSNKSDEGISDNHSSSSEEDLANEEDIPQKTITVVQRQKCPIWKSASNGEVPPNSVQIGQSAIDGEMMFVGRALSCNELIPGKVVPSHECCYVSYGGNEEKSSEYDILVNEGNCELEWMSACDGVVPSGAIEGGSCQESDEPLYVGRSKVPDEPNGLHGGKIHPSHGCCYVPYGGREVACNHYEVLCMKFLFK